MNDDAQQHLEQLSEIAERVFDEYLDKVGDPIRRWHVSTDLLSRSLARKMFIAGAAHGVQAAAHRFKKSKRK